MVVSREDGSMTATITHWADGALFTGTSDRWAEVTNPTSGQVTGRLALASRSDAEHVIESARRAAGEWGATSLARRLDR